MRPGDRLDATLAGTAFLAGLLRAGPLTAPTDASFHLVRVGNGLLRDGLSTYATGSGGEAAPLLGAVVTAAGAVFASGPEDLGRPAGALLLGAAAALLAWTLARTANRLIAVLGVALILLPPALASSFGTRPDAAVAGVLLLGALSRRLLDERPARAVSLAWLGTLSGPVGWPAALALQATLGPGERRDARNWVALVAVLATIAALSLALPAGSRLEILRGLFSGWSLSFEGLRSTLGALWSVWASGILIVAPLVLLAPAPARTRALLLPWGLTVAVAALLSDSGTFREMTAAVAPATSLLLALGVHAVPERAEGGPPRAALGALAVPAALLLFGSNGAREWRRDLREESARDAQVAEFVSERLSAPGAIMSGRTGALSAFAEREVRPLRNVPADLSVADTAPAAIVFHQAVRPESKAERALLARPDFLANYAPLLFRRGPTRGIQDAIWIRRRVPARVDSVPADYPRLLREGWQHDANHERDAARKAFQAAAAIEPEDLGIAHEWLGIVLELRLEGRAAEILFLQARQRDPTTARARGHLADRALSQKRIGQADSLIAEAFEFTEHEAELWGLRARLIHLAGDAEGALGDSERAIWLNPRNGRLLANHGILLWETGDPAAARDFWRLAVRQDRRVLRYLGDFENAPDDAPTPPLIPLFTLEGFHPPVEQRPGGAPPQSSD